MTIKEIEDGLPNGFHDSYVDSVNVDFKRKEATIDFRIDYSSIDSIEPIYRNEKLIVRDVFLFVFEPPFINNLDIFPLWVVDSGNLTPEIYPEWLKKIIGIEKQTVNPCYYFYFTNLNSYMYIGGHEAEWI